MSYVSFEFIIFFCVVIPLYYAIPHRSRWALLLLASYFFYAYGSGWFTLILIFTTFLDATVARLIDATPDQRRKKLLLSVSIFANLSILFTYKYFNFFTNSFNTLLSDFGVDYRFDAPHLILPIGISFYTFQSMAYTIDVYRGKIRAEKNPLMVSTFLSYFPQLVAGPISRAGQLLPQFHEKHTFDYQRVVEGLRLMMWGFFKKVVIADRLAVYVTTVYSAPRHFSAPVLIIATFFFTFQIYCDFSGYSDMAVGIAKIMGFDLIQNFRQPYFSTSIREFWRRWHISLSTWFRDYLYIPLGGNKVSFSRNLLNLMIVFVVSGLWHGAAWHFVIWGALHGLFIVAEILAARWIVVPAFVPRLNQTVLNLIKMGFTFTLVYIAWIFFRAESFSDGWYILTHLFNFSFEQPQALLSPFQDDFSIDFLLAVGGFAEITIPQARRWQMILCFALIGLLLLIDFLDVKWGFNPLLNRTPVILRWGFYYALLAAILFIGVWGKQEFIYFQF